MLEKPTDLLSLKPRSLISKKDLFTIIQYSKVEGSSSWQGKSYQIGNTPQQGINWMGIMPNLTALIIKSKKGAYAHDRWRDPTHFQYSFKSRNGIINDFENANKLLISQPQYGYPILLFTEHTATTWQFWDNFLVESIHEEYVVLATLENNSTLEITNLAEPIFEEGQKKFSIHLLSERSTQLVQYAKNNRANICEICNLDFNTRYDVEYIEAHHKISISSTHENHRVSPSDIALLCPNCHKAVHIYMNKSDMKYEAIKTHLQKILSNYTFN